jgi:hypothetical protein
VRADRPHEEYVAGDAHWRPLRAETALLWLSTAGRAGWSLEEHIGLNVTQLLDHLGRLFARCRDIFAHVDRLEHRRDLPDFGRGYVATVPSDLWTTLIDLYLCENFHRVPSLKSLAAALSLRPCSTRA